MFCPKCGKENPKTAKFCIECAFPLQQIGIVVSQHNQSENFIPDDEKGSQKTPFEPALQVPDDPKKSHIPGTPPDSPLPLKEKPSLFNIKKTGIFFFVLIIIIILVFLGSQGTFLSGSSGNPTPLPPVTTLSATVPGTSSENQHVPSVETTLPASTPPPLPKPSTTAAHLGVTSGPLKTIKDSELWFTLQVPESWVARTGRMSNPEGYEGLVYMTQFSDDPVRARSPDFSIMTYAITRDLDQAVRTWYRDTWTPLPNETTVIINGITFDRFESKTGEITRVAYVVRKNSANERGFASVIEYSLNATSQYHQDDFEFLITTFQYKTAKDIKLATGEEIQR